MSISAGDDETVHDNAAAGIEDEDMDDTATGNMVVLPGSWNLTLDTDTNEAAGAFKEERMFSDKPRRCHVTVYGHDPDEDRDLTGRLSIECGGEEEMAFPLDFTRVDTDVLIARYHSHPVGPSSTPKLIVPLTQLCVCVCVCHALQWAR